MKKEIIDENSLRDKAMRLLRGEVVEVDSFSVKAYRVPFAWYPCDICNIGRLCCCGDYSEIVILCMECDTLGGGRYYLELV